MDFKDKISKQYIIKLFAFALLICGAIVVDNYLDKIPKNDCISETESESSENPLNVVYMVNPVFNNSVKILVQKTFQRKLFEISQNKFLQKFHQLRNFHVLRNETNRLKPNHVFVSNRFIFRHIYFSFHDDKPHIS